MESRTRDVRAFKLQSEYKTNIICTTNYRWWNFIPLNLRKQFQRVANWFFVLIIGLNWVPQMNAVGKYFSIAPLAIVLLSDAVKDIFEDIRRGRQDDAINTRVALCYNKETGQYFKKKWKDLKVGEVIKVLCKEEIPADILLLDTSDEFGFAFADTSTLDGETNLKQRTLATIPNIESTGIRNLDLQISLDLPNQNLSKLNGCIPDDSISLNLENFMLRGSELRNTDYVVGLIVYAGHDTKAMQNNKGGRTKRSQIEKLMNGTILSVFCLLIIICFITAIGQLVWLGKFNGNKTYNVTDILGEIIIEEKTAPYLYAVDRNIAYKAFLSFFTFVIIFSQLIPMSLYIMLEMTKIIQIWFITKDHDLHGRKPILCRSISIAEDLGQVQYIFSDKTGTLTENKMIFKCLTVMKRRFGCTVTGRTDTYQIDEGGGVRPPVDAELDAALHSGVDDDVRNMLVAMAICNTVMVTTEGRRGTSFSQYLPRDFTRIVYEAESPDEMSLVNAAREYGFILLRRTPESCVIRQQKTIMRYKVLCILPFDSHRKCMSIIVIHPRTMKMVMFTKGADTCVRLRNLPDKQEEDLRSTTFDHLTGFAKKGLRTLAFAYRVIEQAEYQQFIMRYRQATTQLDGRSEAVSKACSSIEHSLILLGGTGVEDKLQEGVPEVLSSFRKAGIVVWVLTGDKQETAVSIGYSSQMYSRDTNLLFLRTKTQEATKKRLQELMQFTPTGTVHKQALIINGCAIKYLLSKELRRDFVSLCETCQTVLCCRVTPAQKSQIVASIREEMKVLTLAVGDGANDVGMLRQADIGIGIAGREGTQAVMASDFAIENFKMLQKLVLVHGHWTYVRISDFLFYFFYKNIMFATMTLFYQFFNGFSGSFPQEELMIITFNTFWTTPGTFVSFSLNQYGGSADQILANPAIYRSGRQGEVFNWTNQALSMIEAVYHGILVFSIHALAAWDSDSSQLEFGGGATFILLCVLNLWFLVRAPNITLLLVVTIAGTLGITFSWLYLYGMLPFIYKFYKQDPHYTFRNAMHDPITWANLVVVVILAFLPRILGTVLIEYNGSEFEDSKKRLQILWDNKTRNLFTKERFTHPGARVERVAMSESDVSVGNTVSMSTLTKPEV